MLAIFLIFKLALRNLLRHRVRTLVILIMIVGAFTAVVFFRGFSNAILVGIEHNITNGVEGHIQVASSAIWMNDLPKEKSKAYIENPDSSIAEIEKIPGVIRAAGRHTFFVLLSSADTSIGVYAFAFDHKKETSIVESIRMTEGEWFSDQSDHEILIGIGIMKKLGLKVGQTVTVIGQTLSGSITSVDLDIKGVFKTGLESSDNNTIFLSLNTGKRLLETSRVDRISILLNPTAPLAEMRDKVQSIFSKQPEMEAKTWREVAVLFNQITEFYNIQNLLIEIILAILVFFGILNTVGMSVYERIGEVGTMRALGDRSKHIFLLFVFEGFLMGLIGALLALPISIMTSILFTLAEFQINLPGASVPTVVKVTPVLFDYLASGFMVIMTCVISVIWPVLKALRMSVVDALRANV